MQVINYVAIWLIFLLASGIIIKNAIIAIGLPLNRPRKAIVVGLLALWLTIIILCLGLLHATLPRAFARDPDGRYAASPLKPWFDRLSSKKGLCCSDADGTALSDPDWKSNGGHYQVRLENRWIDVPEDAVITEPNRAGRTMVWPVYYRGMEDSDTRIDIRCFMPGSMG
jgi:hypothetical protein